MNNTAQNNRASRYIPPGVLIGLCILYALFLPPDSLGVRFGFVFLSTTALSLLAWQVSRRLIVLSITIGLYQLMTITLGFDILNTVVLCCAGIVLYLYIALDQSS